MNKVPQISVVMAAFNAEKYVGAAVESILAQTFTDFELIAIDDGSTDNTLAILKSFTDCRVRVIDNSANFGLAKSLNVGIAKSTAPLIARQDADDLSVPTRLEKQVAFMTQNPDIALLGTGRKTMIKNGDVVPHKSKQVPPTFVAMLKSNLFVHGSVMIRKTILDKIGGYNEAFRECEDYNLWLRITKNHHVANLAEGLYIVRRHETRQTWKNTHEQILYRLLAVHCAQGKANDDVLTEVKSQGIHSFYQHLSSSDKIYYHKRLANTYEKHKRHRDALSQYETLQELQGRHLDVINKMLWVKLRLLFSSIKPKEKTYV